MQAPPLRAREQPGLDGDESAERRAEWSRIAVPIVACVILGGGATLLYALALFLPITELLQALAR